MIMVVFSEFPEIIKSMNGIFSNVNSPMIFFFLKPLATASTLLLADDKNEDFTNSNRKPLKQLVTFYGSCTCGCTDLPSMGDSHAFCEQDYSKSCALG